MYIHLKDQTIYVGEPLYRRSTAPDYVRARVLTEEDMAYYRERRSKGAKEPLPEFHIDHSEWLK